jgi:hypothetical protein
MKFASERERFLVPLRSVGKRLVTLAQKQFFMRRSLCTFGQAGFPTFSISGLVGILGDAEVFGQEEKGTLLCLALAKNLFRGVPQVVPVQH